VSAIPEKEPLNAWRELDLEPLRAEMNEIDESAWLDEFAEKVRKLVGDNAMVLYDDPELSMSGEFGTVVGVDVDGKVEVSFHGLPMLKLSFQEEFKLYRPELVVPPGLDCVSF
jgi:hypothetical protein